MAEDKFVTFNKTMVPSNEMEMTPRAQSPFIRFQDKNGDGIDDVCADGPIPIQKCRQCIPNPYSIVSNWRNRNQLNPILNEKSCKYQITYVTPETTTGFLEGMTDEEADAVLKSLYDKYAYQAVQTLVEYFQKDDSRETIQNLLKVTDYTDFYLEARAGSRLKLLYSIDFDYIYDLPPIEDDFSDTDEEEAEADDIVITMMAANINSDIVKLRKTLDLYNRYLKVYRATEGGNLKFKKTDRIFNLGDYGDNGLFGNGILADTYNQLDNWLAGRGYTLGVGFFDFFSSDELITKMRMVFSGQYRIKKLEVYTQGCRDKPAAVYKQRRLATLRRQSGWRDRTAVAYFANQKNMIRDAEARRPKPWLDFLQEHTYPEIYVYQPAEGPVGKPNISDCVANNLENEFKELGQDIFDEVFSIGDAIAKQFHESLCRSNPDEVRKDLAAQGLEPGTTFTDLFNMQAQSQMQNFFTVNEKDPIFINMCKRALLGAGFGGMGMAQLDSLYRHGLGPLTYCGLFDLLFEAIECLFKGLTLEQALGRILLTALKAMGVEDFGALFVGLPPDKRAELDALVRKNLREGKPFKNLSDRSPAAEDAPFWGGFKIEKPWENEEFVAHQQAIARPGPFGDTQASKSISGYDPTQERRTLAQKLGGPSSASKDGLDPSVVLDAYVLALIEVYEDNYLALLDHLSAFPGAQLISAVIALFDCPTPPLFNPGIMDFIKSLTLPFCNQPTPIVSIRLENPFRAWPKISDILGLIFAVLKKLLIMLLMKILLMILAKVCEIIADAICKALETVGAIAGSLPALLSGRESLYGVIRDTICGPDADQQTVEDTVVSLVEQLGVGGAALADRETAVNFFADSINTMTREEVLGAFLDGPSDTALDLMDNIIEFDYPEYRDAFPGKPALSSFFKNVGVLIPAQTRADMRDILEAFPEELGTPANPSMCSTPEELQLFEQQRCSLLEGRMSPAQCEALNESARGQLLEDLDDIAKTLQLGLPNMIEANMPPVFSDPGCNNGMLPYEPEELKEAAMLTVEGDVKRIEMMFASDMLADGGFSLFDNQVDWGFFNMVLSDTYGNPWTVHQDKVAANARWVSFYGEPSEDVWEGPPSPPGSPFAIPGWLGALLVWAILFPLQIIIRVINWLFFSDVRGAYPQWIAGYLHEQFNPAGAGQGRKASAPAYGPADFNTELRGGFSFALYDERTSLPVQSMRFSSTNNWRRDKSFSRSFDKLGFEGFFWDTDVELVDTANYGYNVSAKVDFANDRVRFTKKGRKNTPDIVLTYRDNGKGYRSGWNKLGDYFGGSPAQWGFGYEVRAFYQDLVKKDENIFNRSDDCVRVEVMTAINVNSAYGLGNPSISTGQENEALSNGGDLEDPGVITSQRFEFLSVDDTLDHVDLIDFPLLASSFETQKTMSPPVLGLVDMINLSERENGITTNIGDGQAQTLYDTINQQFFEDFATEIYNNDTGWLFGATYPNYTRKDFEYGVTLDAELARFNGGDDKIGTWVPWWNLKVSDGEGGETFVWMSDEAFLGISYNAHVNRNNPEKIGVFYLEPAKYGGSYNFPPVYAKPPPNTGWTGMLDIMFPEQSPRTCKNKQEGITGFGEVQKMVRDTYASLSEDDRINGDPDCTREVPFDRILTRTGKSAIRGLIMAGIRCFANVEIMRGLGTFTTFAPDFEENYSKMYSGFIVEIMKESFMTTGGNWLNPFNDNEFWYAFLEMSVQYYIDRLDDPNDEYITLENMSDSIRAALERIDRLQKNYKYPWDFDDFNSEDYGTFESMKSFRESKNLEAVKRVEDEAKLILQELVHEQLVAVGKLFIKNAGRGGLSPKYVNMNYYFFNKYCAGGENLALHGEHKFRVKKDSLPTSGYGHYSTGDQLALPSGDPYVGEYHTHIDIDGELIYMAGAEHNEVEEQDRLIPFAHELEVVSTKEVVTQDGNKFSVSGSEELLGDIMPASDTSKNFYLAKYILIDGIKYNNEEGVNTVRSNRGFISDNFPGDMRLIKEQIIRDDQVIGEGRPIGVTGNLGVEYMLEFGMINPGSSQKIPMASTKMSAVDVECARFIGIEANSKILWCLINQLQHEPRYRFVVDYIFSMKKSLSLLAMYNSLGLTPSIGEWVTPSGTLKSPKLPNPAEGAIDTLFGTPPKEKPGMYVTGYEWDPDTKSYIATTDAVPGWLSEDDRNSWFSSFGYLDYDEWDQEILRKTTRYMKNAFHTHYRNRKWTPPDYGGRDPVAEFVSGLTSKFRFNPAYKILPSFQKKQARGNVFDANGNECKKKG